MLNVRAALQYPAAASVAPNERRHAETQMKILTTPVAIASLLACAPGVQQRAVPPAPIALRWPDPAFLPERQCRRALPAEHLAGYLPRASLTMTIPGTRSVTVDRERGCLMIVVESVGSGRLAELIIRGVSVPRRAVLLVLASPERG
jgi:hypothetical protein